MKIFLFGFVLVIGPIYSFAQSPKLILPVGHTSGINMAQFSTDSKYIITASEDAKAKVWEVASGKLVITLEGHTAGVRTAIYSPDGKWIMTTSRDSTNKFWDSHTGQLVHSIQAQLDYDRGNSFNTDGKMVVVSLFQNEVAVLETGSWKQLYSLKHNNSITVAEFSQDGTWILSASNDGDYKIWDSKTGNLLHSYKLDSQDGIQSARLSSDKKLIISSGWNKQLKVWDASTGKLIRILEHPSSINYAKFSPDGKKIASCFDEGMKFWEASGKLLWSTKSKEDDVEFAEFSPSGKWVVTLNDDFKVVLLDVRDGHTIRSFQHDYYVESAIFSANEKWLLTACRDNSAKLWDVEKGKCLVTLHGRQSWSNYGAVRFSPDGNYIVTDEDLKVKLRDINSGKQIFSVDHNLRGEEGPYSGLKEFQFSPEGNWVAAHSFNQLKVWSLENGNELQSVIGDESSSFFTGYGGDKIVILSSDTLLTLIKSPFENGIMNRKINGPLLSLQVDPIGKRMAFVGYDSVTLCDTSSGLVLYSLKSSVGTVSELTFSPEGKYYATTTTDKFIEIWEASSGKLLQSLSGDNLLNPIIFSQDERNILIGSYGKPARVFEIRTGKELYTLDDTGTKEFIFTKNNKWIVSENIANSIKIWDVNSGKLTHSLKSNLPDIVLQKISPDGKLMVISDGSKTQIWDIEAGEQLKSFIGNLKDIDWNRSRILLETDPVMLLANFTTGATLLSFVSIDSVNWVVTHPSGLFDASPGAMDKLYFVQGLDIIDFNQLKERYYEPGLWKKVMAGEQLRNVVGMKSIDLPPEIQLGQVDAEGYLSIKLTNRGGGIGEVNLFVNGKEVIKDARDANVKPDAPNASLKVFVGKHKSIVKGQENLIAVKAWNKDHWVQSRGQVVSYQSKEIESYKPAVHILTCGVSDYTGEEIDLKYAAKDANDVSTALQLGAKKLFGAERSYMYNLTTSQPKEFYPTKTNILKAFQKISSTAHPLDIFVMYVSGHGINYGGQDGDWHYLTQEAYTGSAAAYNDPAIRAQTTISSNELVELFKKVPALKQVLMLDACASGKVVDNLIAQKDIESSTLRALDRMRDRTGMHIITGCTADAVSYEASKYGQGVLTYSLLEGIRGAALREDQYVDVNKLFQYAQDRVPQLAEGIGGIQSPQVFSPQGSQSFDIGLLSDVEKKAIPIAKIRPVFVRSSFLDENEMEDALGLSKAIDESLNEASAKGSEGTIIFVDVREYPDGCKLSGLYRKERGKLILKLRKKCGPEVESIELKADDLEKLKIEILKLL